MTKEEAVQELLKGSTVPCEACNRTGGYRIHDEYSVCGECHGFGNRHRLEYLEACGVLEVTPNPLPKSEFQKEAAAIWMQMSISAEADQRWMRDLRRRRTHAEECRDDIDTTLDDLRGCSRDSTEGQEDDVQAVQGHGQ